MIAVVAFALKKQGKTAKFSTLSELEGYETLRKPFQMPLTTVCVVSDTGEMSLFVQTQLLRKA
jgi:hypothetical protein